MLGCIFFLSESRIIADDTDFADFGETGYQRNTSCARGFERIGVRNPSDKKHGTLNAKNFTPLICKPPVKSGSGLVQNLNKV